MTARFPFTVEYIVKCAACHVEWRGRATVEAEQQDFWHPYMPDWHIVDNQAYCPKHYLALQVDGNTRRLS